MDTLQTQDPHAIGVFRVNHSTTATVNEAGEVTIRQVRKVAIPPPPAADGAVDVETKRRLSVETLEVVVKLDARDFARIGSMVLALHAGRE